MADPIRAALERLVVLARAELDADRIPGRQEWERAMAAALYALAAAPPALPTNYIDPEYQGEDLELLQTFYAACRAEGGTADEIHLRGIRAVLAARPPSPATPMEGEVAELVAALRADAECIEAGHHDLCSNTAAAAEGERRWTEGICGDGAAILFDGVMVPVHEVVRALNCHRSQPPPEGEAIGPEWQPCVKLPITVHVRQQRPGETHVSTREGITPVQPDDLIMRGVQGEEYPIGRELFNQTYRLGVAEPTPPAEGGVVVPSDEDLLRLMPERWTAPVHAAAAIQAGALSYARVVWAAAAAAHQIQPAPPDAGEVVKLVALIRQISLAWEPDACLLGNMTAGQLTRAAELLEQRHPAPVPVAERLPGPGDCDAEDYCWRWNTIGGLWARQSLARSWYEFQSHWLPAHALPLPSGEVKL